MSIYSHGEIMTPEQALSILDQATANFGGNRVQHLEIIKAIQILNEFIQKDKQPKEENK